MSKRRFPWKGFQRLGQGWDCTAQRVVSEQYCNYLDVPVTVYRGNGPKPSKAIENVIRDAKTIIGAKQGGGYLRACILQLEMSILAYEKASKRR